MRLLAAAVLVLALGVGLTPVPGEAAVPTSAVAAASHRAGRPAGGRLLPHGRWLVDGRGRVRILQGLNLVSKRAPYAPDATGFGEDDARFLARHGFTTVRLGVIWRALEPRPGHYDDRYLRRLRATTRTLARHGIFTLLDFHQDLYSERFQGEGAPPWAIQDEGLPAQPRTGFPGNYFGMPALQRAFDHFWANDAGPGGVGLQERYAAAWAHVAAYFRGTPRVLGFDLFNEPWPGSSWQTCANPEGCPAFDAELQAFSQRVIDAIRRVDQRTAIFYEPNVLFNNGAATHVEPTGRRLAFSFHDYCLSEDAGTGEGGGQSGCGQFDDLVWQSVRSHVLATHDAPLLTEYGATRNLTTIRSLVRRAATDRTGWQEWAYCGCADPTTTGPGSTQALVLDPAKAPRGANVEHRKLRALAVPHPLQVAGTPLHYGFAYRTQVFRARWSTARAAGPGRFRPGSRTVLYVPRSVYRHGYRMHLAGGRVLVRNARTLVVTPRPGVRRVSLVVRPRG